MAVITISRQVGSLGDELAEKIAKELGYRYFDKFLMTEIAVSSGLTEAEVIDFNEDNYKVRSFFEQLFGRKSPVGTITVRDRDEKGKVFLTTKVFDEESSLTFVQAVIKKLVDWDNVVILGRGGQVLLRGFPHVLHIRVIAPLEFRIENIMKQKGLTREDALKYISEKDKAAQEYLYRFYNVDWNDPELYHMVLNMGMLKMDQAVKIVKDLVSLI
ncbi:cytidylate kinase-like family protein [Dictyoglomus thermophilum]|uniref:Probable cytidylate kinase, putative n=1 Tax=Dictyoglomus thermophilum (strain ATCC 35947 / DSM 3960 / H-6-12) TaxID=309799 RepID=B5YDK9_DICT6|nr:cytidylate kinase-like family protein [Dictyoglomus thermophilum]ACI19599.1 probable cytidylate kinase, putative [Dictyoglomus thermophilum H-6-12]TYT22855.1 cytidylate kinase-like family protein [Dictyoglomus thermophilum]